MTKRQQAVAFFINQGWTSAQACGLVANLEAESGLRPDAVGDGGAAYGVAQWHPPRQQNFYAFTGHDIRGSTLDEQLAFVVWELNHSEKNAGDELRDCATAAESAAIICLLYERPADKEGESRKRAALAERIYAEYGGVEGSPAAPEQPTPAPAGPAAPLPPKPVTGGAMGAGMIIGLVQAALQAFAPLAQQKISAEIGRHTDQTTAGQVAQSVMDAIQHATGEPDPIQAVAAITAKNAPQTMVQAAQDDAIGRLDKMAPFIDKLAAIEKQTAADEEASRNAAADRAKTDTIDLAGPLTYGGLAAIAALILFVGAIIIMQIAKNGSAATEAWAALTGIIGWVMGQVSGIYNYRFGTTRTSGAKDVLISQLAKK